MDVRSVGEDADAWRAGGQGRAEPPADRGGACRRLASPALAPAPASRRARPPLPGRPAARPRALLRRAMFAVATPLPLLALLLLLTPPAPLLAAPADDNETSPCASCRMLEELHHERVEEVKRMVLRGIGWNEAPVGRAGLPAFLPPGLLRLKREIQRAQNERTPPPPPDRAETKMVWTLGTRSPLAEPGGPLANSPLGSETVFFDIPRDLSDHSVDDARLLLQVDDALGALGAGGDDVFVNVYKVIFQAGNFQIHEGTTETIKLRRSENKFATIDITGFVLQWLVQAESNHGIVIRARDRLGESHRFQFKCTDAPGNSAADIRPPLLEIHLLPPGERRRPRGRRSTFDAGARFCSPDESQPLCCLYALEVDFSKFNWDWIIAPRRYQANFCRGKCAPVFLQHYPHSHIAQQVGGSSGPCCSPHQLAPISMIHWDRTQQIKYVRLPDMVVKSCGCH